MALTANLGQSALHLLSRYWANLAYSMFRPHHLVPSPHVWCHIILELMRADPYRASAGSMHLNAVQGRPAM